MAFNINTKGGSDVRKVKLFIATVLLTASLSMTARAGEWKQDDAGWWYQDDDGTYPVRWFQKNRLLLVLF